MSIDVAYLRRDGVSVEPLTSVRVEDDAAAASVEAQAALESPLGFPPITRAVTPDDYVAIALGEATPAAAEVVRGVVAKLAGCGLQRSRMAVVTVDPVEAESLGTELSEEASAGVVFEAHDPTDDESLCFAGLTKEERPLLLNRRLFDADVLLPVTAEETASRSEGGAFDGLFPAFCDSETIDRVSRVRAVAAARARGGENAAARRREADEAGWLFGAPLVMRIVPGDDGKAPRVLAGEPAAVATEARRLSSVVWRREPSTTSSLIIARPRTGSRSEGRKWTDVGRTLAAIDPIVDPGVALALWTELDEPVGEMLGRLAHADDLGRVAESLLDESGPAALAAWRIALALDRGPVYLRSRLDDQAVEDLGFTPIASETELERLAARHENPILIDDAQHVRFAAEEAAP